MLHDIAILIHSNSIDHSTRNISNFDSFFLFLIIPINRPSCLHLLYPMAKPGSQTTKPTLSAAGEATERDEEEVIDLDAFQAALDESVQSVRAMVDSWMPKDLGPQWNQPSGRTQLSGPVLRPPRYVKLPVLEILLLLSTLALSLRPQLTTRLVGWNDVQSD